MVYIIWSLWILLLTLRVGPALFFFCVHPCGTYTAIITNKMYKVLKEEPMLLDFFVVDLAFVLIVLYYNQDYLNLWLALRMGEWPLNHKALMGFIRYVLRYKFLTVIWWEYISLFSRVTCLMYKIILAKWIYSLPGNISNGHFMLFICPHVVPAVN